MANVGAGTAPAGTFVFPGAITAATTNSVVNAAGFSGSDCGAKINSADGSLGSTGGEIDVNQACGMTWATQAVLSANHNLVFTQTGTYLAAGITVSGNNIIDLRGATLRVPAYSTGSAGLFTFYNGSTVASNVWIENGTLDGNSASTPTGNYCLASACRTGVLLDNGGNSTAVHEIHIQNVTFQNWTSNAIALVSSQGTGYSATLHFPFPYNIYIDNNRFINNGASNIYSDGWDRNLNITNNYFTGWGTGLTTSHSVPISTIDLTGYSGTSQIGMNVTGNTFLQSVIQPDGFGFAGELGAGGLGWIKDFIWSNNKMWDGGSGDGPCLSGIFQNATITGNDSTSWGFCEVTGSNIAITGNTIQNGIISLNPGNGLYSTGNTITGNTISMNNGMAPYTYSPAAQAITIAGGGLRTINLTQAIKQTAVTFNIAGDSLVFTAQTSAGTPPLMTITGSFSGGASNGFQNWTFLLDGAGGTTQGAHNLSNNGNFICYSSTATTISFVNPFGVSETLPTGAQLVSSASTTDYVGTFYSQSLSLNYGGFNGWIGQPFIGVAGFSNAGNNSSALTATATAYTVPSSTVLQITVPNSFAGGQSVTIVAPVPSDALYSLNGSTLSVLSAGLSTSQIEVPITAGSITGSGSTSWSLIGGPIRSNAVVVVAAAALPHIYGAWASRRLPIVTPFWQ